MANTYELISSVTVGAGGTTSVSFASIPQTYTDLKLVGSARGSRASQYIINLSITLLSAVTAGQATTTNMLSQDLFIKVSIASLIISTLNTFFRPHQQLTDNQQVNKKWTRVGTKFDKLYYNKDYNKDYNRGS